MRTAGGSFTVCFVPETTEKCREKDERKKRDFKFWNFEQHPDKIIVAKS